MEGEVRSEISKKSPYYLPRHRFLELKHFSMQYDYFKFLSREISERSNYILRITGDQVEFKDPTCEMAKNYFYYDSCIKVIEKALKIAGGKYYAELLIGVTKGLAYHALYLKHGLTCSRAAYYEMYRKYFFILSELKEREIQVL